MTLQNEVYDQTDNYVDNLNISRTLENMTQLQISSFSHNLRATSSIPLQECVIIFQKQHVWEYLKFLTCLHTVASMTAEVFCGLTLHEKTLLLTNQ